MLLSEICAKSLLLEQEKCTSKRYNNIKKRPQHDRNVELEDFGDEENDENEEKQPPWARTNVRPGDYVKVIVGQKQPSRSVFGKRCSENVQHIYRRTPMLKCFFNKVALQIYWNHILAQVFFCKFIAYFQNIFYSEHLWTAASGSGFLAVICLSGRKSIQWFVSYSVLQIPVCKICN